MQYICKNITCLSKCKHRFQTWVMSLWVYGCDKKTSWSISPPFPSPSSVTRKRVMWKKTTKFPWCSLSLCAALSLCADVNPSRKLFQPLSPLDCYSVDSDLALSTSQKWSNVHTQCLRNPFFLLTAFLYNSFSPYVWIGLSLSVFT